MRIYGTSVFSSRIKSKVQLSKLNFHKESLDTSSSRKLLAFYMTRNFYRRRSKKKEMPFSSHQTYNACLPSPRSFFSKSSLNCFFKETQAFEFVSNTLCPILKVLSLPKDSLIKIPGYQSRSFNIYRSVVSFRKLTTRVTGHWGAKIYPLVLSFSILLGKEVYRLINLVNPFFTRVSGEI